MKSKATKKQRLGNNPYLLDESTVQSQHHSSILTYKNNRLNNSMYSPEQVFDIPDLEGENKQLKKQVQRLREIISQHQLVISKYQLIIEQQQLAISQHLLTISRNQLKSSREIEKLNKQVQEKQEQINKLQQKLKALSEEAERKHSNIKQRLLQCEDIVKELQQNQMKSNAHNMLQTSRIEKLNLQEQTNRKSFIQMTDKSNFDYRLTGEGEFRSKERGFFDELQGDKTKDRMNRTNGLVNNRMNPLLNNKNRKSPQVIFNYTPPKTIIQNTSILPIPLNYADLKYNPPNQRIHHLHSPTSQNRTVLRETKILSPFNNIAYPKNYITPTNSVPIIPLRQNVIAYPNAERER